MCRGSIIHGEGIDWDGSNSPISSLITAVGVQQCSLRWTPLSFGITQTLQNCTAISPPQFCTQMARINRIPRPRSGRGFRMYVQLLEYLRGSGALTDQSIVKLGAQTALHKGCKAAPPDPRHRDSHPSRPTQRRPTLQNTPVLLRPARPFTGSAAPPAATPEP